MAKKMHPVTPEDLYELRQASLCRLSPGGDLLVTTIGAVQREENKNYANLYLQPTRGGMLRQFTQGVHGDSNPQFSPDGRLIAFTSSRSGKTQLHLMHVDGGESWQLTKMEGSIADFAWAPDGKTLCVVFIPQDDDAKKREQQVKQGKPEAAEPKVRHITRLHYRSEGAGFLPEGHAELHIVNAKTGKTRLLFKDDYDNLWPRLTPDGKWVIFGSNKNPDHEREPMLYDLWKIRADGKGKVKKIETFDGPSVLPTVSPDGKWISFTGWPDPEKFWPEVNMMLHVVPIGGGKPRCLSADLDRPVQNLSLNDTWGMVWSGNHVWSPDSREIYAVVTSEGNTELYRFDVEHGGGAPVFAEPGVVLGYDIDFSRRKLYVLLSDQQTPGDLVSRSLDGGKLKRLTRVNQPWLNRRDLGRIEETWVRTRGKPKLQGWVMTPPDFSPRRKYPGILYIHGGPHVAYARAIFHEFNYLAGLGYVVLFCNPRGSHGYGAAHTSAIMHQGWGTVDYEDVMRFTDHVLRTHKFIDRDRLGVTGGSYGGYMTNWIIGHTQRFKAAVTQRSVSNFFSFMGTSDGGYSFGQVFGDRDKTPWQDRERFLEMSPMTHIPNAKTPTLVIHSEGDLRAPIEQGEQVYVQLKMQGVETEMVRFPQETHELSRGGRTDRRIERLQRISGWFDKYLKK